MACPMCEGATVQDYRPFCSRRCADLDLGKWLTGTYAVPSQDLEGFDEAELDPESRLSRSH